MNVWYTQQYNMLSKYAESSGQVVALQLFLLQISNLRKHLSTSPTENNMDLLIRCLDTARRKMLASWSVQVN